MSTVFKPDQTKYELEYKLGEGLNSTVWRATRFDFAGENPRVVALKLPKDQTTVSFLRREYETLKRINSVHVARVIAWESSNDQQALALEWIDGVTLLELAQRSSLSIQAREEIVRQLSTALTDVHAAKTCHGDLHPGNVMIDREGRVCLIDFASGKTRDGLLQATPAFVSPEIWAGADFSSEADMFALKVIREHMLDGFRSLPKKAGRVQSFRPAKESASARAEIANSVARLMSEGPGTQVCAPELEAKRLSPREIALKTWSNKRMRSLAIALVAVLLVLHVPVFAEDPMPEGEGSAKIFVTSQTWMQIAINGQPAGFAPLKLTKIKSGVQHVEWTSSTEHGELKLNVRAGDTVRLTEHKGRLEIR